MNALTVDVEDYFQVEAFRARVSPKDWDSRELRVASNARRVLEFLDAHRVRATFFVLGWVARKVPEIVAEIAAAGHEIACHGHWHRLVYELEPEEFRSDLREATRAIEDAAGARPSAFRAPSFSIRQDSLWALEILAEEGYRHDSSIFPIRHDIYGFPGFPRRPVEIVWTRADGSSASIVEFPLSTVRVLGLNLPGPGGGYLRILPFSYLRFALRRIAEVDRAPAIVYVHPWEFDPEQPRIGCGLRSRFRHYTGLGRTERRLSALLRAFPFGTLTAALEPLGKLPAASLGALRSRPA